MRIINAIKKIAFEASRKEPAAFWVLFSVYVASVAAYVTGLVFFAIGTGQIAIGLIFYFFIFLLGSFAFFVGSAFLFCLLQGITPKPPGITYRNPTGWKNLRGVRKTCTIIGCLLVVLAGFTLFFLGFLIGLESL